MLPPAGRPHPTSLKEADLETGLKHKHVIITGGTRGIGRAMVRAFADEGAEVHALARHLPSDPLSGVKYYLCDVTNRDQVEETCRVILAGSGGRADVLICNAGKGGGSHDALPSEAEWEEQWKLNFEGSMHMVRFMESALKKSRGNILMISSIAGTDYIGAPTVYSTAKAALIAFSKNLSFRLAPEVRVNTICPGNVLFEGGSWEKKLENNRDKIMQFIEERVPMKRFGKPEEIADVALFLASERASFITGSCFVADGGQSTTI